MVGPLGERLDDRRLEGLARAYSDHPSVGLVFNSSTRHFTGTSSEGLIAFRRQGRILFQLGGAIAPAPLREHLQRRFGEFARERGCRVVAVQVREPDVELFHRCGFRLNEFGRSYTLELKSFSLRGTRFMKLRNKLRQPQKAGVQVYELGREVPLTGETREQIDQVTQSWLRSKGRHVKLLEFLVGELGSVDREGCRCLVASQGDRIVGYITYVPYYGPRAGLLHDLTRRSPDAPAGTMELINYTAMTRFQEEGIEYLSFGLTPFIGVDDRLGSHSRGFARLLRWLGERGSFVYPGAAQVAYKLKWAPQLIEREYLAFPGRFHPSYFWNLLRLTRSI